jgi:4-amino-4-deoxy-L-arabinose transferase-like glycosyltransferase
MSGVVPVQTEHPAWTWLYRLIVLYLLGLRLWFSVGVSPMGDEAYYWMWSQHLDWSYFDHPPLHAWLLGALGAILGWSPLALRLLTLLSVGGSLAVLWALARRLSPEAPQDWFWKAAAIYLSLPVILAATTPAFHDHLLVFFALAAFYCALEFTLRFEAGGALRWFYGAAALAGLATLSKYNGILIAAGLAIFLATRPMLWRLWRTPHPYLAALLVAAVQAPVLGWNIQHGLLSWRFHLIDRPSGDWHNANFARAWNFLWMMILPLGPFFAAGVLLLPLRRIGDAGNRVARALALTVFVTSTIGFAALALVRDVLLHWNIIGYAALAIAGPLVLRNWWLRLPHLALGLYMATVFSWNYAVEPLRTPLFYDEGTAANYGWSEVGEAVTAAARQHPTAFLAATRYTYAAQLGFALHDRDVTAINHTPSQYDLWWDAEANRGRDALVVADRLFDIDFVRSQFARVTKLADVPVLEGDRQIWNFELYFAEGYAPAQPD